MDTPAVELDSLKKSFGNVTALDSINLVVSGEEVFGLLGPNGAGKTTAIQILATLIPPTSGTCKVFGHDVTAEPRAVQRRIGLVQQNQCFEPYLTVYEDLRTYGYLCGLSDPFLDDQCEELIDVFGLSDQMDQKSITLSAGQRRRLQIAREFLRSPDLLFLDEPTVGLDPEMKYRLLDRIDQEVNSGMTIVFTSHDLSEVEYLCDRVGFLFGGELVETMSLDEIPEGTLEEYYLSLMDDCSPDQPAQALEVKP